MLYQTRIFNNRPWVRLVMLSVVCFFLLPGSVSFFGGAGTPVSVQPARNLAPSLASTIASVYKALVSHCIQSLRWALPIEPKYIDACNAVISRQTLVQQAAILQTGEKIRALRASPPRDWDDLLGSASEEIHILLRHYGLEGAALQRHNARTVSTILSKSGLSRTINKTALLALAKDSRSVLEEFYFAYFLVWELFGKNPEYRWLYNHSMDVMYLSLAMGWEKGLRGDFLLRLATIALCHDIGKFFVEKSIINKPGRLNPDELLLMRTHAIFSGVMMMICQFPKAYSAQAVMHQLSEGYPFEAKMTAVNGNTKTLTVADMWSSLTLDRPYRAGFPPYNALSILWGATWEGKQDPVTVGFFTEYVLEQENLHDLMRAG